MNHRSRSVARRLCPRGRPRRDREAEVEVDDPGRGEGAGNGPTEEQRERHRVDRVRWRRVVLLVGLHEERNQRGGEHPAEEQLVDDVRGGVGDVVDVGEAIESEAASAETRRKPVMRESSVPAPMTALVGAEARRGVRCRVTRR